MIFANITNNRTMGYKRLCNGIRKPIHALITSNNIVELCAWIIVLWRKWSKVYIPLLYSRPYLISWYRAAKSLPSCLLTFLTTCLLVVVLPQFGGVLLRSSTGLLLPAAPRGDCLPIRLSTTWLRWSQMFNAHWFVISEFSNASKYGKNDLAHEESSSWLLPLPFEWFLLYITCTWFSVFFLHKWDRKFQGDCQLKKCIDVLISTWSYCCVKILQVPIFIVICQLQNTNQWCFCS